MSISIKRYLNLLATYLKPLRASVVLLTLFVLGNIALQLISPQLLRRFIDAVRAGDPSANLIRIAIGFLIVAAFSQVVAIATTYLGETVAWSATNALRLDLTRHCLGLDMTFHKRHTSGELVERIDGDVNALANFFSQMAIHVVSNGLLALGILLLLAREDWRVGAVAAVYSLLTVTALRAVQTPVAAAWGEERQAHADLYGFVGERIGGTEDIRANGAEPYVMARLYRLMRAISKRWLRAKVLQSFSASLGTLLYLLTYVATLALGAAAFMRGRATIGTVYLLVAYVGQLQAPMNHIRRQIDDLQRASASIDRVESLLDTQSVLQERAIASLPSGPLAVRFDRVSFCYDDVAPQACAVPDDQTDDLAALADPSNNDVVLQDLSFVVPPGRVVGLLGRTGSGKTTLTRLLFRLYDPNAGAIELGDVDLRDIPISEVRRRVGLVIQDVQLFRGTVRDNVTLFNGGISDAQILEGFQALGLWSWYRDLPQGLDTQLQTGGKSLSAGEAQLLAFTRVLLKDPGLIILDEASSRLDPATEQLLERAVDRLLQDRTAIVIAHRLATVRRADAIIILEDGRILEQGARQDLAQDPTSHLYSLLQTGLMEALA